MFGVFHDAGYKGMYGGLGRDAIKRRKGIPDKDEIMGQMDTTELAANQFRMIQAREKLARDGVKSEQRTILTHEQISQKVRSGPVRSGPVRAGPPSGGSAGRGRRTSRPPSPSRKSRSG